MIKMAIATLLAFSVLGLSHAAYAQQTVLTNVNILDVETGKIHVGQDVLIDGNKIADIGETGTIAHDQSCLLYTSPSPRDRTRSRMPSSA